MEYFVMFFSVLSICTVIGVCCYFNHSMKKILNRIRNHHSKYRVILTVNNSLKIERIHENFNDSYQEYTNLLSRFGGDKVEWNILDYDEAEKLEE